MRWISALIVLVLATILAACNSQPETTPGAFNPDPNLVVWDRSPQTVIFRADIAGGESDFRARNRLPNCTIFGDNRMVYVNELGPFTIQVLEDRVPDGAISAFVQYLTVNERIYTFDEHLNEIQTQADVNPVVESALINVNGMEHRADSFGGWDADWFPRVLAACKTLSLAPVLVEPSSGWVSAQAIPFNPQPPLATWDSQVTGVNLAALAAAGTPQWISGAGATALWTTLHSLPSNLIFEENGSYFEVALQVPGITRNAPPAP